jgi:hypothetical protein
MELGTYGEIFRLSVRHFACFISEITKRIKMKFGIKWSTLKVSGEFNFALYLSKIISAFHKAITERCTFSQRLVVVAVGT